MLNRLKCCPFCGGEATKPVTSSASDERCGYNFVASITCDSCNASVFVHSKQDSGGWCIESAESAIIRIVELWNERVK